jgi:hypothetical protein
MNNTEDSGVLVPGTNYEVWGLSKEVVEGIVGAFKLRERGSPYFNVIAAKKVEEVTGKPFRHFLRLSLTNALYMAGATCVAKL